MKINPNKNAVRALLLIVAFSTGIICDAAEPLLQVGGLGGRTLAWGIDDLKRLPQQLAKIEVSPGSFVEYQGVMLHDVLKAAGAPAGRDVRGAALKQFVLVQAADRYEVLFALVETDPAFTERTMLLCYLVDGKPLSGDEGPLRLVIPAEKRHARWVRQIRRIDLKQAE